MFGQCRGATERTGETEESDDEHGMGVDVEPLREGSSRVGITASVGFVPGVMHQGCAGEFSMLQRFNESVLLPMVCICPVMGGGMPWIVRVAEGSSSRVALEPGKRPLFR